MRTIAFVTQKGGSGKTTLATNCAVSAQTAGRRAVIIDLDPQRSAEAWYQSRDAEDPRLVVVEAADLPKALSTAEAAGFDLAILDTAGRDHPGGAAAIRAAHLCVIPCRPTVADMKAQPPTVSTIQRLNKTAAFILSQTPPRGGRIHEARRGLEIMGLVCPTPIVSRADYQDAYGLGLGVGEYDPNGKAAFEMRKLWKWIDGKVEKVA
jgi:chromosome partitioning protein